MMKKINLGNLKSVPKKSRHVRWNWRMSPENSELVKYYLIAVDDKDREVSWTELQNRFKG